MTIAPNSVALFTPEAILNVYANALITGLDRSQLLVVGIYQPTGRKPYGVYYYDTLKDETSDYQLTIRVPEAIRTVLQAN